MPAILVPTPGLPSSASLEEETDWQTLVDTQLADTRKTAENWRNGLAALIGVLTAFSLIKGPSELSGLVPWAAYLAGLFLLAAVIVAIAGAWAAIEAAYGSPGLITRAEFRDSGGATGIKLAAATASLAKLKKAKFLTLASLILLALAVGLTWYGPRAAKFTLQLDRVSAPSVCGAVIGSDAGYLDLKPADGPALRIGFGEVRKVIPVEECP